MCPSNCLVAAYYVRYVHAAAFGDFGGGKALCPGCLFAQAETTEFVAMMTLNRIYYLMGRSCGWLVGAVRLDLHTTVVRLQRRTGLEDV